MYHCEIIERGVKDRTQLHQIPVKIVREECKRIFGSASHIVSHQRVRESRAPIKTRMVGFGGSEDSIRTSF